MSGPSKRAHDAWMDELAAFRQGVLARAWNRCEVCGNAPATDAHHRQPRGMGGVHGTAHTLAHRVSNGVAVCRPCHDRIDADAGTARANGWLIPHPHNSSQFPALLFTVNGYGWWQLDDECGYWAIDPDDARDHLSVIAAQPPFASITPAPAV